MARHGLKTVPYDIIPDNTIFAGKGLNLSRRGRETLPFVRSISACPPRADLNQVVSLPDDGFFFDRRGGLKYDERVTHFAR